MSASERTLQHWAVARARAAAVGVVLGVAWVLPGAASAEFGGHLKYQYEHTRYRADDLAAVLVDDDIDDHALDFRLKSEGRHGAWRHAAHYELLMASGADWLALRQRMVALGLVDKNALSGLPNDRLRLFNLTDDLGDGSRVAVQRLDRLSIGYGAGGQTWTFGRQVVSWGNGFAFHVLDFVNPFSPVAIDKDYKTGDDMLYAQWATAGAMDTQAIVLPRRDPVTRQVSRDQGTAAIKVRGRFAETDLDVLLARHYDESIAGLGAARSAAGAVWRMDIARTERANGEGVWSGLANMDYSWVWGGINYYGYAEVFRNGFGETDPARYAMPNANLAARLVRGELYTLAQNYVAYGLQVEIAPRLNAFAAVVRNRDDGSQVVQCRGIFDWRQDVSIALGVNVPMGERGSEFGGIAAPIGYLSAGRTAFVRVASYF